uniref:Ninjurin 2 n=1 Tax=Amphiprion ocellaris TaxID=80972 RepID=A0AAQ5ZSA7_AMPOC
RKSYKEQLIKLWVFEIVCLCVCLRACVSRRDLNEEANQKRLDSLNNITTIIIFLIFVTNIFISVFGMERTGLFARIPINSRHPLHI